jgi:hypothetical protein
MRRKDVNDVMAEETKKDEDEDAMDVEQTSGQPPAEETSRHAKEHSIDQPVLTDRRGMEGVH